MDALMESYAKYLRGEKDIGVCPVIVDGERVALVRGKGRAVSLPRAEAEGDVLENAKKLASELGLLVSPVEVVSKLSYDATLQIGDVKFTSNREDYLCLCELDKAEMADKCVVFKELNELKKLGVDEAALNKIEQTSKAR